MTCNCLHYVARLVKTGYKVNWIGKINMTQRDATAD